MSWNHRNIPDLSGSLAVVTGANSGIGKVSAHRLAEAGAHVFLACRSEERALGAMSEILSECPSANLEFISLDLASLDSVRKASGQLVERGQAIDLLVNNAGVMTPPKRSETKDGFELQFGVNHLGHFAWTAGLWPLLQKAEKPRVVTVASQAHRFGSMNFSDLQWTRRRYRKMGSYGQSKLANLLFAFELDRRCKAANLSCLSVAAHPGWTNTELQRNMASARFMGKYVAMRPKQGALPTLRAAVEKLEGGEYFGPSGFFEMRGDPIQVSSSKPSRNEEDARHLWRVSEELTGVHFDLSA